ncbi:MAG: hypothetical protein V2I67_05750 [Thermoanaerobaculales bacterium]|jgi:hypothetical protein|nr:hypothetical protein [Thermoanaerobaculales bacterium]
MTETGAPLEWRGAPFFAMDKDEMVRSWGVLIEHGAQTVYPAHVDPFPVSHIADEIERRD